MNGNPVDPARAHSGAGDPGGPDGAGDFVYSGSGEGAHAAPGWARSGGDTEPGGRTPGGDGVGDEEALRRLLQSSVGDLEPAPDALEQIRHAVPARRRRRRHAVVGAAAALLLGGTSIPAMVQVAHLDDAPGDRSANAAGNRQTGATDGAPDGGTTTRGRQPAGGGAADGGTGHPAGGHGTSAEPHHPGDGPGAGSPDPYETTDVSSPACGRDQLGKGTGNVAPADSAGRVYGAFRVVNTSATPCSVDGAGTVDVVAQGTADTGRIHVVDHTSGDEATGLPDPATAPDQLVLKPGQAYEVKFAWIPASGGCNGSGPSPSASPSSPSDAPAADDSGQDGGGQGGDTGGGSGGGSGGGGAASGTIVLSHTPDSGDPVAADATLTDACAGTVYRTGVLNGK
ncbi:hypothetical protein [Streptomyces catenulae]|uniref:DUF4232 domain-containing protein n=1 Tax=Streptomyces catenulae TaxID=66875 RepID=A0ABV2Z788_9ACTN|nr:hypothetical protein [Streptomyces catenulae]